MVTRVTNHTSAVGPTEPNVVLRGSASWTFLTNHAHVLIAIARAPHNTLRQLAAEVGITERAVQKIVADLDADGYLTRVRVGRRNSYTVNSGPFRHQLNAGHDVDALLELLVPNGPAQ